MTEGLVQSKLRPAMAWFVVLLMIVPALAYLDTGIAPVKAASGRALVTDTEPNNDYANAQAIVFGDVVKGNMEINNDNKDVFKLHIDANTIINLSFIQKEWNPLKPTDYDANVEFIGPAPIHSLIRRESNLLQIETLSALCIETGEYYVWMYLGLGSKPVNYTMNINNETPLVLGRVTAMPGNLDATQTMAGTNPNVWYKLSIPPTKGIQVTLDVPKGADFDLFALDQWDRLNFYYPGHRNPLWLNASTDNDSSGNFEFLKAVAWEGQYYLRIKGWPGSKGQYKLTIIDFDPVETDGNNLPTQATSVTQKVLKYDNLQMSIDHFDWRKVHMSTGEKINITFTLLTNTYDIYNMSIYDQSLNFVKGVFDTLTGDVYSGTNPVTSKCVIKNFTAPASGDYYVMVMPVRDINQIEQSSFKYLNSDYSIMFDLPDKGPKNILDLPVISFPEDTTYTGLNITKYFQDTEGDQLTYGFSPSYLPNLTVSIGANGTVTMKPIKDWNTASGTIPITFKANDAWANTGPSYDTASTTIKVVPVDDPPYILGELPSVTMNETETTTMQGTLYDVFKDIDTSNLTFKVAHNGSVPVHIDNIEGRVTVGPVDGWTGTVVVNITAYDTNPVPAWSNLTISVRHKNHAPTVVGPTTRYYNISEDQVGAQVYTAPWFADKDISYASDNMTYSLGAPLPTNLMATIETNGLVKIVPLQDWYGKDTIYVVARDLARIEARVTLIVTVGPVNDQPKIITVQPPERDPTMKEGSNMTFKAVFVKDPDKNQTLTYAWTVEGAVQTTTSNVLEFVTDNDPNSAIPSTGMYHIKVEVSDGLLKDSWQWNLTVQDVNVPPANVKILLPKDGASYTEGQSITFTADNASDLEGDYISYTWKDNVTGLMGSGKVLKFKDLKKGNHIISLIVSDGNTNVTKTVSLVIKAKPKKNPPGFEGVVFVVAVAVALVVISRRRSQ